MDVSEISTPLLDFIRMRLGRWADLPSHKIPSHNPDPQTVHHPLDGDSKKTIEALLLGHTVSWVEIDTVELSNGVRLRFDGVESCCSYYELVSLANVPNIITRVELVDKPGGVKHKTYDGSYEIFVLAGDERINLARFEGTDANGYYTTGFKIRVMFP